MSTSAQIRRMNQQGQKSFSFNGPGKGAGQHSRRRPRRGRIRLVLKQIALLVFLTSLPIFGWAYSQGHVSTWLENVNQSITAKTVEAGFALSTVRAEGQVRTSQDAILEALGLAVNAPMYGMDVADLRVRIEALPWVREAVISRELPDTLKVWLEERAPFARWQIAGKLVLIDETAAIISGVDVSQFSDLPFIVGPTAPEAAAELFSVLETQPDLAARVVSAIRVGQRRWDLEFDNGVRLKLPEQGKTFGPAIAWKTFAEMDRDKNILAQDVITIDLRLADRVVIKLTPEGKELYENMDQKT